MRIALIGCLGFAGKKAAEALSARPEVKTLLLVDYNVGEAKKLGKKLGREKCVHAMADAGKEAELDRILEGVDGAAVAVGPGRDYERAVLLACAARKVPVAALGDAAFSTDRDEIDQAFRRAGTTAHLGCGLHPGFTELLSTHFLPPPREGDGTEPFLLFSPDRFGGYAFWRHLALAGLVPAAAPPGLPQGEWFRAGGTLVGFPPGKGAARAKRVVSLFAPFGAVGTEFSAAFLFWMRKRLAGSAPSPVAVAGVARPAGDGGKTATAFVTDPDGKLPPLLLADCVVRLARGEGRRKGLVPLSALYDKKAAEALASAAGCTITVIPS
jgi:hypothetical protein